jgi:cystathionine beta-lyase
MKTIEKNVVSFYSASKTFNVPGLSCAFAVIPCDDLRKAFKKNAEGIIDDANITGLIALTLLLKKGGNGEMILLRTLIKI